MHVLAGAHREGPRPHFLRRDWQICDTDPKSHSHTAVPMNAGDLLLFDSKLPHGTPINRTEEYRWSVQFHYRPKDTALTGDEERLGIFGGEGLGVSC
jgi:phytanoyl-CoA hydroxylase